MYPENPKIQREILETVWDTKSPDEILNLVEKIREPSIKLREEGCKETVRDCAFYDKSLVIEASSLKTFCDNYKLFL